MLSRVTEHECTNERLSSLILRQPSPEAYVAYQLLSCIIQNDSKEAKQCFERVINALLEGKQSYFGWRLCSVALASPQADVLTQHVRRSPGKFPLRIVSQCGSSWPLQRVVGIAKERLDDEECVDMADVVLRKVLTLEDARPVLQGLWEIVQDGRVRGDPLRRGYWIQALLGKCSEAVELECCEGFVRYMLGQLVELLRSGGEGVGQGSEALEVVTKLNHQDEMLFSSLISLGTMGCKLGVKDGPLHYAALFSALLTVYDYDYELFVDLMISSEASVVCVEYLMGVLKTAASDSDTFVGVGRFEKQRLLGLLESLELVVSSASFPFSATPLARAIHQVATLVRRNKA